MAKHCTHCGQELPKDDAQFCSRCGMLVSSESSDPQVLTENRSQPGVVQTPMTPIPETREAKPGLREQIAQQPTGRSAKPSAHPASLSGLEREISSPSLSEYPPLPPTSESQVAIEDLPTEGMPAAPGPENVPTQKRSPKRPDPRKSSTPEPSVSAIADVPTRSMPLTPSQRDVLSDMPARKVVPSPAHIEEIALVDTLMLPKGALDTPLVQPVRPASSPSPESSSPAAHFPVTPQPPLPKSRRSPLFVLLLVILVLVVAASVWVVVARPFSVAEVTQPWQQFNDPSIGIAMQYPAGWPSASRNNGAISLHDSSNTAMVTISTMAATAGDPTHALQQQATKVNMTGVKTLAPLSFAGVNWQREQGSVQMNGATYTITLLAGVHRTHLYTLGQLAAQNVYSDYEQAIFAPMRASLRFL